MTTTTTPAGEKCPNCGHITGCHVGLTGRCCFMRAAGEQCPCNGTGRLPASEGKCETCKDEGYLFTEECPDCTATNSGEKVSEAQLTSDINVCEDMARFSRNGTASPETWKRIALMLRDYKRLRASQPREGEALAQDVSKISREEASYLDWLLGDYLDADYGVHTVRVRAIRAAIKACGVQTTSLSRSSEQTGVGE